MNTNNNLTSPNFGMAMRIRPEAKESLMKAPQKLLEGLKECGEELKNSKYVDLVVDNGPSYHIYDRGADVTYTKAGGVTTSGLLRKDVPYDEKALDIWYDIAGGGLKAETLKFPTERAASVHCNSINNFDNTIGGDYKLGETMNTIRAIEASRAYTAELAAQKAAEKAKGEALLNDLFSEFGS